MTETIGKITLDYSKYPGADLCLDGLVEDELLELVSTYPASEFPRIIEEKKNWPILYHLSPLRENIVEWIPMDKDAKVLEIGSDCGAITGALSKKAGNVTCVERSKKRSRINAWRHKDCENITIHVGDFKDIERSLDRDFDYIFLIGVKYEQSHIGGESPSLDSLTSLCQHLAHKGRIIIAAPNKYGLKYFAGCKEDSLGTYFGGIENYTEGGDIRTFGRRGLEKIFRACDVEKACFYYPYPDYKFMTALYSDSYLPGKGELSNNLRNFDQDRMVLFDEKRAFDGIVEEGLFSVFSNSYLAVVGEEFPVEYVKYSNDRAKDYVIRTQIGHMPSSSGYEKNILVRKYPLSPEAEEHIKGMALAYENLLERYQGGKLFINQCTLLAENGQLFAQFEYVEGTTLSELMDRCLEADDMEGFRRLFREYVERIGYGEEYPVADYDLVFSNLLVLGDRWTLIDYEWTFDRPISTKELAFRAVYCYLLEDEKTEGKHSVRNKLNLDYIFQELSMTEEEGERYKELEMDFQKFVTGQRRSMTELRDLIGYRLLMPQKWIHRCQDSEQAEQVQIYEDIGDGYAEERSYFIQDAYQGESRMELTIKVNGNVKMLRIDPLMDTCVVKILKMTFNGESIPLQKHGIMVTNGKAAKAANREAAAYLPSIVFPTTDPNINIRIERLHPREENILYARMEVIRLPEAMAQDMAGAVKKNLLS